MTALATLLLTVAPPPFSWHWPAVREHWPHVSAELEASVQVFTPFRLGQSFER